MTPHTPATSSTPPSRHAWIDASAGVAGDMLLGALVDAGADLDGVQTLVDCVLPDTVRLTATDVNRAGLRACKVEVSVLIADQPYRQWSDIRTMLEHAELPTPVRAGALRVFEALAVAEGRVHGVAADAIHFHEVGAWDSIADVVGVCAALHLLDVDTVSAGPIALGSGRIRAAHGDMSVPVPAVLELSAGWQVFSGGEGELATPTGVALIRGLSELCESLPALTVDSTGMGAGTKDVTGRANVVRVVIGNRATDLSNAPRDRLSVLATNVDDLDPRVWPDVLSSLMEAGAADAWLTPILMKKGRPAHTLSVLCDGATREALRELIFTLTSTFGIREYAVDRVALQRDWRTVTVAGEALRVKLSLDAEGRIRHTTPELDDAAAVARATGLPLRQVLDEARSAAESAGIAPGATPPGD